MQELSKSLQSAQKSLQQAGLQSAKNGQQGGQQGQGQGQGKNGESGASDEEWGKEFRPGGSQQAKGSASGRGGQKPQGGKQGSGSGQGMQGAGRGAGGSAGPQQPLPGSKKDSLITPMVNEKGDKLTRSYMGTPDPTQDRAAYYSVVPQKTRAAEASLNREEIPAGYKKQVKEYFESIQPK
ncbi:MAG: hypothetical protein ACK47B_19425 [Armatimonadota bacterium]